jgi:Spy/CpxP family protein refolding chaperone
MTRNVRFALSSSALLAVFALGIPATALAAPDAPAAAEHAREWGHHGHHHHAHADLVKRALALPSLNNAQRAQVEALAQESQTTHAGVHAARANVLTTLAGQVDRGAIDRAALAPALKAETDAAVAARLRQRSIAERLHVILTAAQCAEVGGGKDFLGPAPAESDVRAKVERRENFKIDRLEKKLPGASAEERAKIAAKLRAHATK